MAYLMSVASGNLTDAIWGLIEPTSFVQNEASNYVLSTTTQTGNNFTPGAITIDGIGVNLYQVKSDAFPTATITVWLSLSTDTNVISGTQVTRRFDSFGSVVRETSTGWAFFKFNAPVTLLAATAYRCCIVCNTLVAGSMFTSDSSGSNRNFFVRRYSSAQSPAAGDTMLILQEVTNNQGTVNNFTVTMNSTSNTTTYGQLDVGNGCTLNWGTSAGTAYYLKMAGNLRVRYGGTLNIGSVNSRLPANSSATIEFACTSTAQYGFQNWGGTVNMYGDNSRNWFAKLTQTANSSQAVINVDDATGWTVGDTVVLASTSATYSQAETKVVQSVSGNQVTLSTNLTYNHTYYTGRVSEVVNLTKNIIIRGTNTTNTCYVRVANSATNVMDGVWIRYSGNSNANWGTQALTVYGSTTASPGVGSVTINYCSVSELCTVTNGGIVGLGTDPSSSAINTNIPINFTNNAVVSPSANAYALLYISYWCDEDVTVDNCVLIGSSSTSGGGMVMVSHLSTVTNVYISSFNNRGVWLNPNTTWGSTNYSGPSNLGGWQIHSCGNCGIYHGGDFMSTVSVDTVKIWFCNIGYQYVGTSGQASTQYMLFSNWSIEGCTSYAVYWYNSYIGTAKFVNCTFNGPGTHGLYVGLNSATYYLNTVQFHSCSFGATSTFTTADIGLTANSIHSRIYLFNTTLNSGVAKQVVMDAALAPAYYIAAEGTTGGAHKTWLRSGVISSDTVISKSTPQSLRLTPSSATAKLGVLSAPLPSGSLIAGPTPGSGMLVPVTANAPLTVSCYVRKSVAGDGAAYNGNEPRLLALNGPCTGTSAPVVLATASGAAGSWEQLSGTITPVATGHMSIYVDCDGTAGWVNVDDFGFSQLQPDSTGMAYAYYGAPLVTYGSASTPVTAQVIVSQYVLEVLLPYSAELANTAGIIETGNIPYYSL